MLQGIGNVISYFSELYHRVQFESVEYRDSRSNMDLELTTFIESLTGYTTALTYLSLSLLVLLTYIDEIVPWKYQNWEVFHEKTLKSIQPLYKHHIIIYSKTFIYYLLAFETMITKPVIWFEINRFINIFQLPSIKIYFTFTWVIINHDYAK